jgi:CRP-like cAMP-binding protein
MLFMSERVSMAINFDFLRQETKFETVPAGQVIFQAGQAGECMYFVQQGEVDILSGEQVINTHGKGEIFGEMALIDGKSQGRSASAIAKTDCQLVAIDERQFLFLVQQHPSFALNTLRVLADRLRKRT